MNVITNLCNLLVAVTSGNRISSKIIFYVRSNTWSASSATSVQMEIIRMMIRHRHIIEC